jgi:hypothetical protein
MRVVHSGHCVHFVITDEGDRRVYAAAPNLLKALKALVARDEREGRACPALDRARTVIAQTEGNTDA